MSVLIDCQLTSWLVDVCVYGIYIVTSTYVSTGGSVSNALFMAVSTRVGNCLGEGDPVRAKKASIVGFLFAAAAGSIISAAIFGPSSLLRCQEKPLGVDAAVI